MKHLPRGFTLIEVLIALAIISIAFTAILLSASQHIRNTQYLEQKVMSQWVAANLMNQARAGLLSLNETETQQDIQTELLGEHWLSQINLAPTANPKIKKITVTSSAAHENNRSFTLVSYVYKN